MLDIHFGFFQDYLADFIVNITQLYIKDLALSTDSSYCISQLLT